MTQAAAVTKVDVLLNTEKVPVTLFLLRQGLVSRHYFAGDLCVFVVRLSSPSVGLPL